MSVSKRLLGTELASGWKSGTYQAYICTRRLYIAGPTTCARRIAPLTVL